MLAQMYGAKPQRKSHATRNPQHHVDKFSVFKKDSQHTFIFMETAITSGIEIIAEPSFLPEHSYPVSGLFVFAYHIEIKNRNNFPVQLRKRHWVIISGTGDVEHVYGDGVVGEFPLLGQNESFVYTSSCQLPTPIGTMEGEYIFENKLTGKTFAACIPRFRMEAPVLLN